MESGEHMGAGEHVDFVAHVNEGAHVRRRTYVGENVGMRAHVCHAVCLRELRAHNWACVTVHAWVLVPRRVSGAGPEAIFWGRGSHP